MCVRRKTSEIGTMTICLGFWVLRALSLIATKCYRRLRYTLSGAYNSRPLQAVGSHDDAFCVCVL